MAKYLDPKIDVLFKKIFGENKDLVISFLNSLLPLQDGQEILTIEYLSPEQVPKTPLGKNSIVDIRCIDSTGRSFIVEMQTEWSNIFRKRLLVNGSKAVVRQLNKKSRNDKALKFSELQPVYVLAIVNDNFTEGKDWYHHLQIMDSKNPDFVIAGLDFVLVELPKFTPETWTYAHKQLAVLWLRFLKEIDSCDDKLPKELKSNKLIRRAIKLCEEAALTPEELAAYERAEEEVIWQNSIKALEDDAIENKKLISQLLAESKKALSESKKAISEKDKAISEKDKVINEKDKALEDERKAHAEERIAREKLEAELIKMKNRKV
jgi:predicted transposase/invertase (TIGR01784 family)